MDTIEEDIHIEDLQLHTVCNRERYTIAIKRLLERWSKYSVKALGKPHPTLEEPIRIPEIVFEQPRELYNQNKQISNIKTMLEEQIKLISILKNQENCPISQKMKEL